MSMGTYILGIVAALIVLVAIIELMRRGTLRERHAVWWLVGVLLALVVAVFPRSLTWAARLLGIAVPTNLVFFVAIGLLFLVSLQYGAELTRVEAKLRTLAEQAAFADLRLRELEARVGADDEAAADPPREREGSEPDAAGPADTEQPGAERTDAEQ